MSGSAASRLRRVGELAWEIPARGPMHVPARVYASPGLIEGMKGDRALEQACDVAGLPGILRASLVMPDAHQGYGFPIGGVAAFDPGSGVISPGGVGYDINCGVRLLVSDFAAGQARGRLRRLLDAIRGRVPTGTGRGCGVRLDRADLEAVCAGGARWAVENGLGTPEDLERTEDGGCLAGADPSELSRRAVERGEGQLGSLGSGNHFLELQVVEEVMDGEAAEAFGAGAGRLAVMIHCGSRGLGHQVASDYVRMMADEPQTRGAGRQLACAPLRSPMGESYYAAMCAAANYAFANRQVIAARVREAVLEVLGGSCDLRQVYDVCHNVAKMEVHGTPDGEREVCVHRKGATRSFGPGRPGVPEDCRAVGQPVLLPGSMGTATYLMAGTRESEGASFGSAPHGAGRVMSRSRARKAFPAGEVRSSLASMGVELVAASGKGVSEEASGAYKDIEEVVAVSAATGLARPVARLVPLGVIKG